MLIPEQQDRNTKSLGSSGCQRIHHVRQIEPPSLVDYHQLDRLQHLPEAIIRDLNTYGVCVLDDFLGEHRGKNVLAEVLTMYSESKFTDGKLMRAAEREDPETGSGSANDEEVAPLRDRRQIRGDKIAWVDGQEPGCDNIAYLINQVDRVVLMANQMQNNGQLANYHIRGRTKAMLACYPSFGTQYVKHVDNPNGDGRCITATYYLNPNWDAAKSGGLLRVYPENQPVLDIAPQFDRIIFFWSDRRNPHAVQPAHRTRFAITMWYHDAAEREKALRKHHKLVERRRREVKTSFEEQ